MGDQASTLLARVFLNRFAVIVVALSLMVFAWLAWEKYSHVPSPQMSAEERQAVMESLEDSTNTQGVRMDEARKEFTEERKIEILDSLNAQQ
jgi:lysylphosphatidylglycerol synthetase-like protein (DUF2156 family)